MRITFSQSESTIAAYDFVEVTLTIVPPPAGNPFTDIQVVGQFQREGNPPVRVDGFCHAADGSVHCVRFMPTVPGEYTYAVTARAQGLDETGTGAFSVEDGKRRGLIRVDRDYPWHFIWEGTGEHYFWNGTTTYFLMGWDDANIERNIARLHRLGVNRIRVAVSARVENGRAWFENVYPTAEFSFLLNPWTTERPASVAEPGHDVTRFNLHYWQKWDRMLRFARERDMIVSVVFYTDGRRPGTDPFGKEGMGGKTSGVSTATRRRALPPSRM